MTFRLQRMKTLTKNGATTLPLNSFAYLYWIASAISFLIKYLSFFLLPMYVLIGTQVVAPVRETVSQTLASLLLFMPRRSLFHVHSVLLQMIRQDFVSNSKTLTDLERGHIWEVRHAGLLGIKYEVAVRSDMFDEAPAVKQDDDIPQIHGRSVLQGVVEAAILG